MALFKQYLYATLRNAQLQIHDPHRFHNVAYYINKIKQHIFNIFYTIIKKFVNNDYFK